MIATSSQKHAPCGRPATPASRAGNCFFPLSQFVLQHKHTLARWVPLDASVQNAVTRTQACGGGGLAPQFKPPSWGMVLTSRRLSLLVNFNWLPPDHILENVMELSDQFHRLAVSQ